MSNKLKRKVLDEEEVRAECAVIQQMGYQNLLLVTGEHETKGGMDYFRRMLPVVKPYASYLMMEVQPLDTEEYRELIELGLDAVMVYQETYHPATYAEHHLRGKKQDMRWRMETPDRLGAAGIDKIGLGALLGLADWRTDSLMLAHHLEYLRKRYWTSRYSMSFPRLRPCTGGFNPGHPMSDRQLVQLICAWRLLDPELELSLSTRESAEFRDGVIPLHQLPVAHRMSRIETAGTGTQPRKRHRVATGPVAFAQILKMMGQHQGVGTPISKPEQGAQSDLVDASRTESIRSLHPPTHVLLLASQVVFGVGGWMVGLLIHHDGIQP
jgi:thiazole biosynthesis protein ThiH